MVPTKRLLILAALGLVPAVLAAASPTLFAVALAYLGVLAAMMAGGYLFGVQPAAIEARRTVADRLSMGEVETVEITLRSAARVPVRVTVTDTLPPGWEAEGLPSEVRLEPDETATVRYQVTPAARGRFRFGDLYLRLEQAPGLIVRQFRVPAAQDARVFPDLREIARYEALARRSRLEELGIHRSRLAGRGTEFERIREYTPDDEYRNVDWKATARRQWPMSRVYEVERSQNVLIVVDAGRMMAGRVGKLAKLDYAVNAALMLAHVALQAGDKIGLMVVSDQVDSYLPLGKGAGHFNRCLELLYGVEARLCHVDFRGAMEQIALRCKRRSLVVLFTDLLDEHASAELVQYLRLLRPTHLPLCVTLQDPQILGASRQLVSVAETVYTRAVATELLGERRRVLDQLQKLGGVVLDVPPDELSVRVVNQYLELKYRQLL